MRYKIVLLDENNDVVQADRIIRGICEVDIPCQGIERSEYDTIRSMVCIPQSFLLCPDFMEELRQVLISMEWDAKHHEFLY